jgi:acyl carrier protein
MGLDSVELVMAVEEAFDITIADAEAEKIVTVRDMIDCVYARVALTDTKVCRTQRAFHRLRRASQDVLGARRSDVRPTTQWESLVPRERRRALWQTMRASVEARRWPELERSATANALVATGVLTATIIAAVAVPENRVLAATVAAAASSALLLVATRAWRLDFGPRHASVGQVAEMLAPELPAEHRPAGHLWTRDEVRTHVRTLIAEHANVDPSFADDASFIDDLGLD